MRLLFTAEDQQRSVYNIVYMVPVLTLQMYKCLMLVVKVCSKQQSKNELKSDF